MVCYLLTIWFLVTYSSTENLPRGLQKKFHTIINNLQTMTNIIILLMKNLRESLSHDIKIQRICLSHFLYRQIIRSHTQISIPACRWAGFQIIPRIP
jgi:hypothetical protein